MKLKNLFYLLLAMPLAFAACEKSAEPEPQPDPTPDPQPEYVVDMEMAAGMRVAEIAEMDLQFDENEFMLAFVDETQAKSLTIFIMGEDGQKTLQAGTYTAENDIELGLTAYVVDGEAVGFADANVVVAVDADVYDIEAIFTDAEGGKYRFTYEGEIINMSTNEEPEPQPSTPVFELVSEATMEFSQDSQIGTIKFKLENPVSGVSVTAKSNQSWVNNITVREADGEIAFMVDANTGAAREAKITATYGVMEFKVTVKQAEYVAPAPELIIDAANEEFEAEGGNGEIAFHVKNAVEGVQAAAVSAVEWITVTSCADGIVAYTVAANETDAVREGIITLTYGEVAQDVKIKQYFAGYNPGMEYSVFEVVEIFASAEEGGKMWEVIFIETDRMLGDMQTRICFHMDEANAQRVSDGTYTVENGGILVNTSTMNGFSTYRANGSLATDITVAEITVTTDTDAKVISFVGTFQAGNNIVTLNYTGEVRGMDLGEAVSGTIVCNEWKSVKKNWEEAGQFMFTAKSSDGTLSILFNILHSGGTKLCPEGTYQVSDWSWQGDVLDNTTDITYNGVAAKMVSGYINVEHISGGYNFTFELTDANGRSFEGTITGPVENGTNPA